MTHDDRRGGAAASPRQPARTVAARRRPARRCRDQQRQRRRELAHRVDLGGKVAPTTRPSWPLRFHGPARARDVLETASPDGERLRLQVGAARVRGAAQQDRALAVVAQVGLDRVEAHERRQRHRVGAVALEGLARVLLGGAADVAALGVEDHRHVGRDAADVRDQALELRPRRGAPRSRRSAA
jgi:hypothetical protein